MNPVDDLKFPVSSERLPPPPARTLDEYHQFVRMPAETRDAAGTNHAPEDRPLNGPRFRLHDSDDDHRKDPHGR